MSDGNIQAARTRLLRAVQLLTGPRSGEINGQKYSEDSLYDTLLSNLPGTQGDTRTPAKSLPPLWIDACQLIVEIDLQTRSWCRKPGNTPKRLQILAFHTWRPQDTKHVESMARAVEGWCEHVKSLLNPESRKEITAPCPSCGKRTVYKREAGGEVVRIAALALVIDKGCTCLACDAHWSPEYYLHLSRLLEIDLPEGVLE